MSGELNLKHTTSGKTIRALILGQNRTTRWNGSAMVAINTVSDANWTTGMISLVEQQTQTGTPTATYVGDFPSGITQAGEFAVEYYLSTAATPGSPAIGVQDVYWKGTALATVPGIQDKTDLIPAAGVPSGTDWTAARATKLDNLDAVLSTRAQESGGNIAAIKNKTDNLPANPAAVGDAMTLTSAYNAAKTAAQAGDAMTLQPDERNAIAAALLDLANAIDNKTLRQALQIIAAVVAGKVSGAGSGTESFRNLDDSATRVIVAADPLGNRTNVTYL